MVRVVEVKAVARGSPVARTRSCHEPVDGKVAVPLNTPCALVCPEIVLVNGPLLPIRRSTTTSRTPTGVTVIETGTVAGFHADGRVSDVLAVDHPAIFDAAALPETTTLRDAVTTDFAVADAATESRYSQDPLEASGIGMRDRPVASAFPVQTFDQVAWPARRFETVSVRAAAGRTETATTN